MRWLSPAVPRCDSQLRCTFSINSEAQLSGCGITIAVMLIDKNDSIGGVPIVLVRDALRRLTHRDDVYVAALAHYGKLDLDLAQSVIDALVEQGRLEAGQPDRDGDLAYAWTIQGYALANASAGKRFKRATAQRALEELLQRAEALNANPLARFGVDKIVLFGSFLDPDAAEVSDVDLAIGTFMIQQPTPQEAGDAYYRMRQNKRPGPDEPLLNFDVLPYLKGGKAVLSPVDLEQHQELLAEVPHRTIWQRS